MKYLWSCIIYIFCVNINMILYQARDCEGKGRSDGQAGNTTSFSAALIKLLQSTHQIASSEQGYPPIQLKSFSSPDSVGERLLFQTTLVCKPLFNDKYGEGDLKRFILPAGRSAPAGLHGCGLVEEKLKDAKPILFLIQ